MNLLEGLNPEQKQAVTTINGPLLIMAGAGSGKTRVLTHRVAHLIGKGVAPWNILAVTFTNKAAKEMKERVQNIVGSKGYDVWVSTFHSLCVRILRKDIDKIGYETGFTILDSSDQLSVIKGIMKAENLDVKKFDPRGILSLISQGKNELLTPEAFSRRFTGYFESIAAQVYEKYQKKLKSNNALDFDDIIMLTVKLFKDNPEVLEFYQRKFVYIHIDEYQDTNRAQYILVQLLADYHKNICVVGDYDQSIYRFRGADIQNILSFEKDYPDAQVIKLEKNYRSTKNILLAANEVIKHNTQRKEKNLWTDNEHGDKIQFYQAYSEYDEAQFITQKILDKVNSGATYKDIAILYRTNAQSRVFEEMFMKSNIPYTIVGGLKFYDRKEIKDVLGYLRLIANPKDDTSLVRIINVPRRGIGAATIDKIAEYSTAKGISMYEACQDLSEVGLSARAVSSVQSFFTLISTLRSMQEFLPVTELVEELLKMSGYRKELQNERTLEAQSRLENIDEFISVTTEFEKTAEDKSLIAFLTDLALISDLDKLEDEGIANSDAAIQGQVVLMTMHSAKGLEFPIVFLAGLEEGIFPHNRSLMDETEMEEERRLCYVGITRAERELYMTCASARMLYGKTQNNMPSRFLEEIPAEFMERTGNTVLRSSHTIGTNNYSMGTSRANINSSASTVRKGARKIEVQGADLNESWNAGDKVEHKAWGIGTIVSTKGEGDRLELTIAFDKPIGLKKLLAKFAPVKKL
ncbi:DNA helicase PcrA [Desulfuribacillus alkaliarsenatis]|uniref:ATP-dependent DNA helicase n=1 Tax=Desulfuribacillus alkaliarsenatis TaxID=766136 RepID=A0A1E5G292_9FIRM|nr:DNA helicase PcrA [Desulfuribacillus alkaliarsenatis]OEF97027.1 ATP-dependent DNA helicase PcrA [Desulfuribacillus alkaliarsenatis]